MWQAVHAGAELYGDPLLFLPKEVTKADYDYHRSAQPHSPATAIIGFGSGFGGRYYGGFRAVDTRTPGQTHHDVALRGIAKKYPGMRARGSMTYACHAYDAHTPAPGTVIYCDPPYKGTAGYSTGSFDHEKFWQWCREQAARGCHIFISEYTAPEDFTCIWETEKRVTLNKDSNTKKAVEKLFTVKI